MLLSGPAYAPASPCAALHPPLSTRKTKLLLSPLCQVTCSPTLTHTGCSRSSTLHLLSQNYLLWGLQNPIQASLPPASLPQPPHLTQVGSFTSPPQRPPITLRLLYPSASRSPEVINLLPCLSHSGI